MRRRQLDRFEDPGEWKRGSSDHLGDRVRRRRLETREARLVPGEERRAEVVHLDPVTPKLCGRGLELGERGAQLRLRQPRDVSLDDELHRR